MADKKKIIIIGTGPGGYVAAIRAAQLGADVTVIEKGSVGGTCLNRGCIPTKALLSSANLLRDIRNAGKFGVKVGEVGSDLSAMVSRANRVVGELNKGIEFLFKKNGVKLTRGRGEIVKPGTVRVSLEGGSSEEFGAGAIIIAVGSIAAVPKIFPFDGKKVITSSEALGLTEVPGKLLIVGGGAIGLEFASILSSVGAEVSVVEMMKQLLPGEDREIAGELCKCLKRQKINVYTDTKVEQVDVKEEGVSAGLSSGDTVSADKVLVAVGRVPDTKNIGVEGLDILDDKGFIKVNEKMETSVPGIYAIGDAAGGLLLAHKASEEGVVAAENALGLDARMDYSVVPRCVFTHPEVACVGLSEDKAKEANGEVKIGKFPFIALGKARAAGETEGMVKIISDASSDEILGVHIIGPHATDLIGEAALAMKLEATAEDLGSLIHAHPTLPEAIREASLAVDGKAIHI